MGKAPKKATVVREKTPKTRTKKPADSEQPRAGSGDPLHNTTEPLNDSGGSSGQPLPDSGRENEVSGEALGGSGEPLPDTRQPLNEPAQASEVALWFSGEKITKEQFMPCLHEVWQLHQAGIFRQMLEGKAVVADSGQTLTRMPSFPGEPNGPTSIVLNTKLKKLALEKAKSDPGYPSGVKLGISGLVTWLIWQYVGCPSDLESEREDI